MFYNQKQILHHQLVVPFFGFYHWVKAFGPLDFIGLGLVKFGFGKKQEP